MLTGLGLAIFIWCAAAPFVPYTMFQKLSQVAALIAVVAMMGAASHDAWHGNRSARIFLLAWVVLIVATIGLILSFNAIIRNMLLAKYSVLIGSTIEVVLIAVGLADRMRILQREKEDQQRESLERQRALTIAYARFVPPQLLDNLGRTEITQVQLGDVVKKEMTVLFSDIRGFTSLSEQMTPEENFQFLNAILRRVGPVIRQHGGFIDKYIGDAIMALFSGDPGEAIRAAVAMRGLLAIYNERRGLEGFQPIQIGMGINTGDLMLGMIGEPERLEGTVISDAVNLASRLEGLNKFYGTTILVSEQTLFRIGNPAEFASRIIDRVRVRGKRGVVTVFEIFAGDLPDVAARKEAGRGLLERGIDAMLQGEFLAAATHFAAVLEQNPDDLAARRHLDRARHHSVHGAPERWEGVTDMD